MVISNPLQSVIAHNNLQLWHTSRMNSRGGLKCIIWVPSSVYATRLTGRCISPRGNILVMSWTTSEWMIQDHSLLLSKSTTLSKEDCPQTLLCKVEPIAASNTSRTTTYHWHVYCIHTSFYYRSTFHPLSKPMAIMGMNYVTYVVKATILIQGVGMVVLWVSNVLCNNLFSMFASFFWVMIEGKITTGCSSYTATLLGSAGRYPGITCC